MLVSPLALCAALSLPASAQVVSGAKDTPPAANTRSTVEEVIVTGTNLRGVAPVGSAIIGINRDDIVTSGAVTTVDLLEQSPQITNLGLSATSRGQTGGSANSSYNTSINLRGLGPYSTLTLVDSHRVVPQGTTGQAVDPSIIPTIMLQRVDIEADGASATYGSDAIAGVVNLVLRRNFEGLEVTARGGVGNHYDDHQFDIAAGKRWDSGQFTVGFENSYNSELNGQDRSFFSDNLVSRGGSDFRPTTCNPGNIVISGVTYPIPAGGVTAANKAALVPGAANKCDPLKSQDILPMQNHYSAVFTLDQHVNDRVDVSVDGIYAQKDIRFRSAPVASTLTVPSSNPYFVSPNGVTPPFCAGSTTLRCESVAYNFSQDLPGALANGHSQTYQLSIKTDVRLFADWKAELYGSWGRHLEHAGSNNNGVVTSVLNGSATTVGSLSNPNPGSAFNPFGGTQSAAVLANISNALVYTGGATSYGTGELKFSGTLFRLPAGPVSAAFGYQGQSQLTSFLLLGGSTTNPTSTSPEREFYRNVTSFYGEVNIPIFGGQLVAPGLQGLDIDIAARHDYYSDIKASTSNPKVGVNWTPIEGVKARATYSTSFRAPVFSQIYGNSAGIYVQAYSDPTCNCTISGAAVTGPNLGLVPETSKTWTAGVDFKPTRLPGLSVSLTYFNTVYQGQVNNYLANLTLLQTAGLYAGTGIINRNPSDSYVAQFANLPILGGILPNACSTLTSFPSGGCANKLSGIALVIDARNKNLGTTDENGIDFQASYRWTTASFGAFKVGINGTYFTEFAQAFTPTGAIFNELNTTFNPLALRFRTDTSWSYGPIRAAAFVNYANAYDNTSATPTQTVGAYTTVDLHLAYVFDHAAKTMLKDTTFALQVTNLFDTNPPFVNVAESSNGGGGWDPVNANPIGRVIALSIDKKW
jgi:iron complex outermembrane receptor protein